MNNTYLVDGDYFKNTGQHIKKISNAVTVTAHLLQEKLLQHEGEEGERFNGFIAGGLYDVIELLADQLSRIGEDIEERPEVLKKLEGGQ